MYSDISEFECLEKHDKCYGYAAPDGGMLPTSIFLFSDEKLISACRATLFSKSALDKGLRFGFCGFEISGISIARAMGNDVQLRCARSGRLLLRLPSSATEALTNLPTKQFSVEGIISHIQHKNSCDKPEFLLPFALETIKEHGSQYFMEVSYRAFLNREPEPTIYAQKSRIVKDDNHIVDFLNNICASHEFKSGRLGFIPGPFNWSFPYSLRCFDRCVF